MCIAFKGRLVKIIDLTPSCAVFSLFFSPASRSRSPSPPSGPSIFPRAATTFPTRIIPRAAAAAAASASSTAIRRASSGPTRSISRTSQGSLATDNIKANLIIKNIGKRTYTLSFPNAQRYELKVLNPAGQLVYQWSLDKKFTEDVGIVMVNPTDRIGYTENISLSSLYAPLMLGNYSIEMSMANYPEIVAKAVFKVLP